MVLMLKSKTYQTEIIPPCWVQVCLLADYEAEIRHDLLPVGPRRLAARSKYFALQFDCHGGWLKCGVGTIATMGGSISPAMGERGIGGTGMTRKPLLFNPC